MALSEKLYTLRKKSGLSQEQLAEKLKVSRQAISKWESGASYPESDKLIAISRYFNVSLDYLVNEDGGQAEAAPGPEHGKTEEADRGQRIAGLVICICGIVLLIVWGLASLLVPAASNRLGESSTVIIDGNGVYLLLCAVAVVVGAVLLLRGSRKK